MKRFFIPASIDLESLVKDITRPDVRRNLIYGSAYILNYMYRYPKTIKGKDVFERSGGGVPLNMKTLRSEIGSKTADRSLKLLFESGVLKILSHYIPIFHKSRLFTFERTPDSWKSVSLAIKGDMAGDVLKDQESAMPHYTKELNFLTKWLNPSLIKIDLKSVDFFVQYFYNRLYFEIKNSSTSYQGARKREYMDRLQSLLNSRFSEILNAVTEFDGAISRSGQSRSNGRLNTALTQLIKPVRNFLVVKDGVLVEVDITASQPYMLLMLLIGFNEKKNEKVEDIEIEVEDKGTITSVQSDLDHMLSTFSDQDFVQLSNEVVKYRRLFEICDGDFYENLCSLLNACSSPRLPAFSNRNRAKKAFMHLLFEKFIGKKMAIPTYLVFKKVFPQITRLIDELKRVEKNRLAIILQRLESEFVLDRIAEKFANSHPHVPIYTIHDSLITTEEHVKHLQDLIKSELANATGVSPSLKTTILSPSSLFDKLENSIQTEVELIKDKARKKKPIQASQYKFFRLFEDQVPKWEGKEVMTISVWTQLKNYPKYKPFVVKKSKLAETRKIWNEQALTKTVFSEDALSFGGVGQTSSIKLPSGHVVPHLFSFEE